MFLQLDAISEHENTLWLAGLLEGEGYFGAVKWGDGNRRWVLRVSLNMCDRDIVERARQVTWTTNLTISAVDKTQYGANWNVCYAVQWTGRDAEEIMRRVLPYMGVRRTKQITDALVKDCGHRPKTHCPHGHAFTPENTRPRRPNSGRKCRTCERERSRERKRRAREAAAL